MSETTGWRAAAAPGALILAAAAILWRPLFGGEALSGGDLINHYIPYKALALEQIRAGEFPAWNPLTFSGRPLQADIQVGVFYPPNALFLLAGRGESAAARAKTIADVFDWLVFLHLAWMAAGAYLFLRLAAGGGAAPAGIGAAVFALGGFWTAQLHSGIVLFIFAGSWLPWMLWAAERAIARRQRGGWLALAAFGALQLLAGSPQISFYSWILTGGFALVSIWTIHRAPPRRDSAARPFGLPPQAWAQGAGLAAAAALAAGLAAAQWVPTREFLDLSFDRARGASWDFVTDGSLEWRWLLTFLAPFLFQHPAREDVYWGGSVGFWEFNGFAGVAALALAVAGLAALAPGAARADRRLAVFALACLALWLALAPGRHSPLFRLAYWFVPGFSQFRVPARWAMAWQMGVAILAALGWKTLASGEARKPRLAAAWALGALALAGAAMAALRPALVPALLRAGGMGAVAEAAARDPVAAAALASDHRAFAQSAARLSLTAAALLILGLAARKRAWGPRAAALAFLAIAADLGAFAAAMVQSAPRAAFANDFYRASPARQTLLERLDPALGQRWVWDDSVFDWRVDQNQPELYPNRPILDAAPAARGYDPVCSRRYGELFNAGAGLPPGEPPRGFMFLPAIAHPRVFSLLNVRLVLSYLDPAQGALPETARIDFPEGPLRFFENADAAGPAFLARPAPLAPAEIEDPLLGLGRLLGPQFDWRAEALVERPHPRADAPADSAIEPALEIAESGYGRWRFRAACAEPSVLVLSQSWYPGWRVWIDGEEGEAVAADWALVGAFLDPGRHDVEFRYRPRALERGARASLAALALWLLLSGAAWIGATKNHR